VKFETLHGVSIPKIGFGTWRIAGEAAPDPALEVSSRAALLSAIELGYTHFDTAEYYAGGGAEILLGETIKETGIDRERLFITTKVSPFHLHFDDVLRACENSLERLGLAYIDLYLIHWPNPRIQLEETFRALNRLVREGKVKYLGVSNFKLDLLKRSQELSETPILTDQVPYSLNDRSYLKNGVLEYCQQSDILFTAYSPIDEGKLRTNAMINSIAKAHGATPYQIALAWVIAQPRVITIPMSANPKHIAENFEAADITLTTDEISQLTAQV
jgi:diketogulonate reductase-like aldo/keto reductase